MKKVLLILFVLAICVLAMPQGVLAATTQPATVSATLDTYIELFPIANPAAWANMKSGNTVTPYENLYSATSAGNVKPLNLKIETNKAWTITAEDLRGVGNKGCMTGTAHQLRAPMEIEKAVTPFGKLDTAQVIGSGDATKIGIQTFTRDLNQKVYSDDTPEAYTITITFTAANT